MTLKAKKQLTNLEIKTAKLNLTQALKLKEIIISFNFCKL